MYYQFVDVVRRFEPSGDRYSEHIKYVYMYLLGCDGGGNNYFFLLEGTLITEPCY